MKEMLFISRNTFSYLPNYVSNDAPRAICSTFNDTYVCEAEQLPYTEVTLNRKLIKDKPNN